MTARSTHQQRWHRRPEGSNWGDFGPDDQAGRLNTLTPAHVLRAVSEVRDGRSFALSLPLDYPGGTTPIGRSAPRLAASRASGCVHNFHRPFTELVAGATGYMCDDVVTLHTQYSTQWDGLGHVGVDFDATGSGTPEVTYYNGFRASDFVPPEALAPGQVNPLGMEHMAVTGAQGRGVLIDLQAVHGTGRAAVGYAELMRILEAQGVQVLPGDFVCIYTGYADLLLEMGRSPDHAVLGRSCPGLDGQDPRLLQWITDSGAVALCSDNTAVELVDRTVFDAAHPRAFLPLHEHCLFKLGVHLGELWFLTDLAVHLRSVGRCAFLLTAPPLRLPGASGSPATPVATT